MFAGADAVIWPVLPGFWTFAKSPAGRLIAVAIAIPVVMLGCWARGNYVGTHAERGRWEVKMAAAEARARTIEANGAAIATALKQAHAAEVEEILAHRETTIRRIPVYVTREADANCPVTSGVVSVFNASVSGAELPATPSGPVDTDTGIALSELTEVAAYNSSVARELRAEVMLWRTWYRREAAAYGLRGPVE